MPVVPAGARHATINVNGIDGGQPVDGIQTPCVADRCRAVFDRRFLLEEGFDATKAEIVELLDARRARDAGASSYQLRDLMVVASRRARPTDSPVIAALDRALHRVLGEAAASSPARAPTIRSTSRASPASRTAWPTGRGSSSWRTSLTNTAEIDDLVNATKVIALAMLDLTGTACLTGSLMATQRPGHRRDATAEEARSCAMAVLSVTLS